MRGNVSFAAIVGGVGVGGDHLAPILPPNGTTPAHGQKIGPAVHSVPRSNPYMEPAEMNPVSSLSNLKTKT